MNVDYDRWMLWLNQAASFAEHDAFADAIGRTQHTRTNVQAALDVATGTEVKRLQAFLSLVEGKLNAYQVQYETYNDAIAARRQKWTDDAAEEMKWPMPLAADVDI